MTDESGAMYRGLLTRDFMAFSHRALFETAAQVKFQHNWHLDVLAFELERVRINQSKRLIINLPPRSLKSHLASVAFPAWLLGHNPSLQIMCVSYAQDLAEKLARDCRTLMQSQFYQSIFETRLSPDKQAVAEFETTDGGCRFSTSIGGVVTGRGADIIIIDDPLKADEAPSELRREFVNAWFDNALYSRLNHKEKGAIIIVMQRLHEDDLVGHVAEKGGWNVLSFPAIAETDETYAIATPYGERVFQRKKGEALHPERESLEVLSLLKQRLGTAAFSAQYQQAPSPPEGLLVKANWFPRYSAVNLPLHFDAKVLSCDTANKITQMSDYSVCSVWGTYGDNCYLLYVLRRRMEFPELKRTIIQMAREHHITNVLIEDRASGTQLVQELKQEGVRGVEGITPPGDKQMRLNAQTPTMEAGFVYLPESAPWLDDYIHELTTFPNCRHDDQVDSTSQALAWIKRPNNAEGWIRYLREQLREAGHPDYVEPYPVRVQAPPGISHLFRMDGTQVAIPGDRIVSVSQMEANGLRCSGWQVLG